MNERAVEIARDWLGTPYVHQASLCGAGSDCLGLIRGIWRELYGKEPEQLPEYTQDWGEVSGNELLLHGAIRHLERIRDAEPDELGSVLLFRMRQGAVAKHLGLLAAIGSSPTFIHAYERHGVVESPLSAPWREKIVARFRFR